MKEKLYLIALDGLRSANQHNPFWSKGDAFRFINEVQHGFFH